MMNISTSSMQATIDCLLEELSRYTEQAKTYTQNVMQKYSDGVSLRETIVHDALLFSIQSIRLFANHIGVENYLDNAVQKMASLGALRVLNAEERAILVNETEIEAPAAVDVKVIELDESSGEAFETTSVQEEQVDAITDSIVVVAEPDVISESVEPVVPVPEVVSENVEPVVAEPEVVQAEGVKPVAAETEEAKISEVEQPASVDILITPPATPSTIRSEAKTENLVATPDFKRQKSSPTKMIDMVRRVSRHSFKSRSPDSRSLQSAKSLKSHKDGFRSKIKGIFGRH